MSSLWAHSKRSFNLLVKAILQNVYSECLAVSWKFLGHALKSAKIKQRKKRAKVILRVWDKFQKNYCKHFWHFLAKKCPRHLLPDSNGAHLMVGFSVWRMRPMSCGNNGTRERTVRMANSNASPPRNQSEPINRSLAIFNEPYNL